MSNISVDYDTPRPLINLKPQVKRIEHEYDFPKPLNYHHLQQDYDTPSPSTIVKPQVKKIEQDYDMPKPLAISIQMANKDLHKSLDKSRIVSLEKSVLKIELLDEEQLLDEHDFKIVTYFASKIGPCMQILIQAIGGFLFRGEHQMGKVDFTANGKYLLIKAQCFVYCAVLISRSLRHGGVKKLVDAAAEQLTATLQTFSTKMIKAAKLYPDRDAVQDMVDAVNEVSKAAGKLKSVVYKIVFQHMGK